ncbi:MAG: hypothetical protein ACXACG_00070 [Candidatus Thorarchaeota archaeon]|jgi:hypothetical protein
MATVVSIFGPSSSEGKIDLRKVELTQFVCPACKDGTLVNVKVKKTKITKAEKHPTIVTTRCPNDHSLVVFVDINFKIRDVEVAADAEEDAS